MTARDRMSTRPAGDEDLDLLADWNAELIVDEGHKSPMTVPELRGRFAKWMRSGEYQIVFFDVGADPVAYAVFTENDAFVYLRHFFVRRDRRRLGVGRRAMCLLFDEVWPAGKRCLVDALSHNASALAFWRAVGYRDYCVTLEKTSGPRRPGERFGGPVSGSADR